MFLFEFRVCRWPTQTCRLVFHTSKAGCTVDWRNCFGRHRLLHLSERTRQPPVLPCTLCFVHGFTSLLQCDTTGCACGGGGITAPFLVWGTEPFTVALLPCSPPTTTVSRNLPETQPGGVQSSHAPGRVNRANAEKRER